MKCAVVVVLCGLSASFAEPNLRARFGRRRDGNYFKQDQTSYGTVYDRGYSDYQQGGSYDDYPRGSTSSPVTYDNGYQNQVHSYPSSQHDTYQNQAQGYPSQHETYQNQHVGQYIEQPNVLELNNNLHYSEPHKYQENNYVQYAPVPQGRNALYYSDVLKSVGPSYPTHSTPVQYGAPLAPYPVQYNQHQIVGGQILPQAGQPQPNYNGYDDLFGGVFAPTPSVVAVTQSKPTTTKATTIVQPPSTQQPNNIFSLLLSLSQASSSISLPGTTRRPAPTAGTTVATAQPSPKAQVFSFANIPPPVQSPQVLYPPQRRGFSQFFG